MERMVHLRVLSVGRQSSCGHAGTRRAALPHAVRRPSPGRTVVARPLAVVLGPDVAGAAAAAVGSSTESVSLALSAALALAAPTVFSLARDTSCVTPPCVLERLAPCRLTPRPSRCVSLHFRSVRSIKTVSPLQAVQLLMSAALMHKPETKSRCALNRPLRQSAPFHPLQSSALRS